MTGFSECGEYVITKHCWDQRYFFFTAHTFCLLL